MRTDVGVTNLEDDVARTSRKLMALEVGSV